MAILRLEETTALPQSGVVLPAGQAAGPAVFAGLLVVVLMGAALSAVIRK